MLFLGDCNCPPGAVAFVTNADQYHAETSVHVSPESEWILSYTRNCLSSFVAAKLAHSEPGGRGLLICASYSAATSTCFAILHVCEPDQKRTCDYQQRHHLRFGNRRHGPRVNRLEA